MAARRMLFEPLEDRRMLALASPPDELLDLGTAPVSVQLGRIDDDGRNDLVALESNGDVTVALNNGDDTWREIKTSSLAITNASGMALGLVNADPYLDLVVQGANEVVVALRHQRGRNVAYQHRGNLR